MGTGEAGAAEGGEREPAYSCPNERTCVVCQAKEGIYRCARCLCRTCSLACYKAHERRPRQRREILHSQAPPPPPSSEAARAPYGETEEAQAPKPGHASATASLPASSAASSASIELSSAASSAHPALPASASGADSGGCPLVRCRVKPVALRDFDEASLLRDFRLVEEAARVVEAAVRHWRCEAEDCAQRNRKRRSVHPQHLRALCVSRGIRFLFCPPNFSRRKSNTTRVVHCRPPGSRAEKVTSRDVDVRDAEATDADVRDEEADGAGDSRAAGEQEAASEFSPEPEEDLKHRDGNAAPAGLKPVKEEPGDGGESGGLAANLPEGSEAGEVSEDAAEEGARRLNSNAPSFANAPSSPASSLASPCAASPAATATRKKKEKKEAAFIEWRAVFHFRQIGAQRVLSAVHEDMTLQAVLSLIFEGEKEGLAQAQRRAESSSGPAEAGEAANGAFEKKRARDAQSEVPRAAEDVDEGCEAKKRRTAGDCASDGNRASAAGPGAPDWRSSSSGPQTPSPLSLYMARRDELVLLLPCVGSSCSLPATSSEPVVSASTPSPASASSPPESPSPATARFPSSVIPVRKCESSCTLREALRATVVVEFPEFFVALPEELPGFRFVERDEVPLERAFASAGERPRVSPFEAAGVAIEGAAGDDEDESLEEDGDEAPSAAPAPSLAHAPWRPPPAGGAFPGDSSTPGGRGGSEQARRSHSGLWARGGFPPSHRPAPPRSPTQFNAAPSPLLPHSPPAPTSPLSGGRRFGAPQAPFGAGPAGAPGAHAPGSSGADGALPAGHLFRGGRGSGRGPWRGRQDRRGSRGFRR
ncbi:hypothetical protein BESB_030420 [Besnoitia besnoiti]|uniref:HIT-type domain-containing protein n=1 Tax=Besnoitia besnoiti TaxID=94643 RepID=A0A2A9LXF5_BESBE|nr:hypothetical protein BESB_030420 [Besnoitia besnoiti]PFH31168.1 hypothetical protein BESB_030420 [Besnoitia besnoiti]